LTLKPEAPEANTVREGTEETNLHPQIGTIRLEKKSVQRALIVGPKRVNRDDVMIHLGRLKRLSNPCERIIVDLVSKVKRDPLECDLDRDEFVENGTRKLWYY
jgi:hypothetical protein